MPEYPPSVYTVAWYELYKVFSEQIRQEGMDLMDSVLQGVALDMEEHQSLGKWILDHFPHLDSRKE